VPPVPLTSIGLPAGVGTSPPLGARERVDVTSVQAIHLFPGPRPLLLDPEGGSRAGVTRESAPIAAGWSSTPPTHDLGAQEVWPEALGGHAPAGDGRLSLMYFSESELTPRQGAGIGRGYLL